MPDFNDQMSVLLDDWLIHSPDELENPPPGLSGWWAVSNKTHGIVAYFKKSGDAYLFRRERIWQILNPDPTNF